MSTKFVGLKNNKEKKTVIQKGKTNVCTNNKNSIVSGKIIPKTVLLSHNEKEKDSSTKIFKPLSGDAISDHMLAKNTKDESFSDESILILPKTGTKFDSPFRGVSLKDLRIEEDKNRKKQVLFTFEEKTTIKTVDKTNEKIKADIENLEINFNEDIENLKRQIKEASKFCINFEKTCQRIDNLTLNNNLELL